MTLSRKHKDRKKKHMAKVYNRMSELQKTSLHYYFSISMNIKLHSNFRIFTITQSTCHTSLVTRVVSWDPHVGEK